MKRFWDKVKKTDNCWVWIAGGRGRGYGAFNFNGKIVDAHRVAWQIVKGEIPKNKIICHSCNNRLCVNPKHLYAGTYKTNAQDAIRAGTYFFVSKSEKRARREQHPCAVLSQKDADDIRKLYKLSEWSQRRLAKKFGVHRSTVRSVLYKETWWK